jgi:hypothetical protein
MPTKINLHALKLVKLKKAEAVVELTDSGVQFDLPREILPADAAEGDRLEIKLMHSAAAEENHTLFAQRLLEEIIN